MRRVPLSCSSVAVGPIIGLTGRARRDGAYPRFGGCTAADTRADARVRDARRRRPCWLALPLRTKRRKLRALSASLLSFLLFRHVREELHGLCLGRYELDGGPDVFEVRAHELLADAGRRVDGEKDAAGLSRDLRAVIGSAEDA